MRVELGILCGLRLRSSHSGLPVFSELTCFSRCPGPVFPQGDTQTVTWAPLGPPNHKASTLAGPPSTWPGRDRDPPPQLWRWFGGRVPECLVAGDQSGHHGDTGMCLGRLSVSSVFWIVLSLTFLLQDGHGQPCRQPGAGASHVLCRVCGFEGGLGAGSTYISCLSQLCPQGCHSVTDTEGRHSVSLTLMLMGALTPVGLSRGRTPCPVLKESVAGTSRSIPEYNPPIKRPDLML